jgi:hypothetical protein
MQTDYAQILPIILPAPKAGPSAPANVASADGKAASPTSAEGVELEAAASDDSSGDPSTTPSAFDQALALMMMVQVPVQAAKPAPQAPSQQGLATNPMDITAALDGLQPGAGLVLAQAMDAGSDLMAPLMTAPAASDLMPDPNLQAAGQVNNAPQTLPSEGAELAIAIGAAAPKDVLFSPTPQVTNQNAPARAANFAEPAPIAVSARSSDAAQAIPVTETFVGLTAPAPDTASVVPSVPIPVKASADRQSQEPILQAMGDAVSDPKARVTGTSVPQPLTAPNLAPLTAPEPDQAQPVQSATIQAPSVALIQTTPQATTAATGQVLASAQSGVHETAQANSRATKASLVSGEATSTSTPSISTPLTAVAIATNGGANSADTGGSFEDAPTDLADTAAAKAAQSDSDASTDIFGAPLPLEGRITQASLQAGSSATLSTPATAPHLAAEISRKFEGKSAQFDISLTPEGLGKVDVKITINARGEVSAAMKFDNPQAAAELKGRAAELQRALEQSGFSLSQEGISFTDGQGQGFNAPQQQASQQDWQETARRAAQSRLFQDTNDLVDAAALRVAEASSAYSRRSSTGVDVRI